MFGSKNLVTDIISKKIAEKEVLNEEEQKILKEEFKIAKSRLWISRLSVMLIIFIEIVFFIYIAYRVSVGLEVIGATDKKPKESHVAVLNLDKALTDKYADQFISSLIKASKDPQVKSIVVRLRSPGGTPSSAWNITNAIKKIQKTKSLFIYVDSAAVSGSYMIASQSDKIYANPFAMVGSIGVIMEHIVVEDLANKVGVGQETLTAGKFKKTLSTFKYLSEEDKALLEKNLLNEVYEHFKDIVAKGRNLTLEQLEPFTEGRIFVAADPRVKGTLVDEVLDWSSMKEVIIEKNKLKSDITFFNYEELNEKNGLLSNLMKSSFEEFFNVSNNSLPNLK